MKTTTQKTETVKRVFFILLVLLTVPVVHALAGPAAPGGGIDAGGAPIDGGISLLVAAGVGYGVKKVRAARQKAAQQNGEAKNVAEA